jgi:phosphoglycerol transferase MdoB-like AlkP superfamily enzyme
MGSLLVRATELIGSKSPHPRVTYVAGNLSWLYFVAFYCILCNIPYWIAAHEFGFSPLGWFCATYAGVGLIALFVPRLVTLALLLVLIAADIICGACMTYFVPVRECLQNIRIAVESSAAHSLRSLLVFLSLLVIAAMASLLPSRDLPRKQRRLAAACLLPFAVAILCGDVVSTRLTTGYFPPPFGKAPGTDGTSFSSKIRAPRLARIPLIRLKRLWDWNASLSAFEEKGRTARSPVPNATAVAIKASGIFSGENHGELPDVVVTVVESWGAAKDSSLQKATVEPYLEPELLAKYQVFQGSVPFYGATVAGEARELCGNEIGYYLIRAPASDLKACVPERLASLGYQRIAVHGMSGLMFDRLVWYHTLGFQELWFQEELKKQGLPNCGGAFLGTCDADIAAWIGRRLEEDTSRPKFIHWMTLNSHLPVPVPSRLRDAVPCTPDVGLHPESALCSWYQLVENVHRSVAQLASGPLGRPTIFVVVGDHAPPFGDPDLRDRFSQDVVPYVVLVPRSEVAPSKLVIAHNAPSPTARLAQSQRQTP